MKEHLKKLFIEKGYRQIEIAFPEVFAFFKRERHFVTVILTVSDDIGTYLNEEYCREFKKQVREFLENNGMDELHFLTLVLSASVNRARRIAGEERFCWVVDCKEEKLMIYDNQVVDFYGLKAEIENWLLKGQEEEEVILFEVEKEEKIKFSFVNITFIAINVILFLICTITGEVLYNIGALDGLEVLLHSEYYRFITAIFLHGDINHLVSNMLLLYLVGNMTEKIIGHVRYGILYLFSAIAGGMFSVYVQILTSDYASSVGASGAIFGIAGALLFLTIAGKGTIPHVTIGKMLFLIGYSLYSGFVGTNIDNAGHVGGLFAGTVIMTVLYIIDRIRRGRAKDEN